MMKWSWMQMLLPSLTKGPSPAEQSRLGGVTSGTGTQQRGQPMAIAWISCCWLGSWTLQTIACLGSLAPSRSLLGPVAACSAHCTIQTIAWISCCGSSHLLDHPDHCLDFLLLISSLAPSRSLLAPVAACSAHCST